MAYYPAETAYLYIKPEATDGTPVIPTIAVPLVSESLKINANHAADRRMKGVAWKGTDLLRGSRQIEGDIVVLADATVLAHFFNMLYTKGSTTGGATGYTHPFTVGAPKSYTIEIKRGPYAQRYFGVKIDSLKLGFTDGRMTLTAKVAAKGQFSVGRLAVELTGAGMTTITFADDYDEQPSRGLLATDVIVVGGTEVTVATVTAGGVTMLSTAVTAAVGDTIYLKPQAVALPTTLPEPFMMGQVVAGFGADAAAAATAAGSRSTSTPVYDLEVEFKNNLYMANGSQQHEPAVIYPQTPEAQVKLTQVMQNADESARFLTRGKRSLVLIVTGRIIDPATLTRNKLTLTFNNVKLLDNPNTLKVGSLIADEQQYEVLYDATDGAAVSASVINPAAGTVY